MPDYILNPNTGRYVKKYGSTHRKLIQKNLKKGHFAEIDLEKKIKNLLKKKDQPIPKHFKKFVSIILNPDASIEELEEVLDELKTEEEVIRDLIKTVITIITDIVSTPI